VGRRAVVDALNELAFCAELLGDERVDPKAIAGLSWAIRSLTVAEGQDPAAAMLRLTDMTPRLAAVVDDAAHDRASPFVDELKRQLPPGLLGLRRLKGLGPKKIQKLWRDLGVESLGELEYACKENRLVSLEGFGDKTQKALLEQLHAAQSESGLCRRDHAEDLVSPFLEALNKAGHRAVLAGDFRRGAELIRDIVVVTTGPAPEAAPPLVRFVASVPVEAFGRALLLATGSDAHLEALRARGDLDAVAGADEADVYRALGLAFVDPEAREAGCVLVEVGKARPKLIERRDLRGALHNHTTASDGTASVAQMAQASRAYGLEWIGITDHSESASYAHGLDARRLREQRAEVAASNGFVDAGAAAFVFAGVESDILKDGALDYPDDVLLALDCVVASMHQRYGLKGPPLTERLVKAALHKAVDVVGHPTGRLLLSRAPADFDVSALIEACALSGCAVELNANPARLDLNDQHLREAKARGVMISIAADAHAVDELPYLDHGVAVARRAGLTAEDVLNSRSAAEVKSWIAARRARPAVVRP
jgi:DNA polymerase (family 10)